MHHAEAQKTRKHRLKISLSSVASAGDVNRPFGTALWAPWHLWHPPLGTLGTVGTIGTVRGHDALIEYSYEETPRLRVKLTFENCKTTDDCVGAAAPLKCKERSSAFHTSTNLARKIDATNGRYLGRVPGIPATDTTPQLCQGNCREGPRSHDDDRGNRHEPNPPAVRRAGLAHGVAILLFAIGTAAHLSGSTRPVPDGSSAAQAS